MTDIKKKILAQGNAAITDGDHEGFLALCTDDTEWTFVGDQVLRGKEAVRRWMANTYLEPPKVTVEHLIAEGNFLTAVGTVTVKNAKGEAEQFDYCDVWTFQDERISALKGFVIKSR